MDNSIGSDNTIQPGDDTSQKQTLSAGDTLGQYKVIRMLGRGGMGEVCEVEHGVLHKRYALKLLPADFAKRSDALERFRREARVMANLEHPNIIQVDDFGETNGRYWLRMELAEGTSASEVGDPAAGGTNQKSGVKQLLSLEEYAKTKGGRLNPDEAQIIFTQILEGLAYAHSHGVVHRDLKPSNILICPDADGNATFKIADFGLVRMVGEEWVRSQADQSIRLSMSMGDMATEAPESAGTSTRSMIGTYEYMSPEQKRGEEATAASDVYALGLMMYRLLTGRQLGPRPPSYYVKDFDPAWDELILTSLEEDPADRFAAAGAMLAEIGKLASPGQPGQREPALSTEPVAKKSSRQAAKKSTPDTSVTAEDIVVPDLGMEMVYVLPGSFQMGSNSGDADDDEQLVHTVQISQCFWIGRFPVTQGEYEKLIGKNPSYFKIATILGIFGLKTVPRRPVEQVSWNDAKAFCEKLTDQERRAGRLPDGYEYRLPTEAEWEYAARGGAESRGYKYSGSDNAGDVAWYGNNSGGKTHEVGTKRANELGIYDMSGNVWEWCNDWYDSGYYGKSPGTDPVNTDAASDRVIRGGSWYCSSGSVRSAYRGWYRPGRTDFYLGFRVCLAPRIRD